jgi:hypothetical protein
MKISYTVDETCCTAAVKMITNYRISVFISSQNLISRGEAAAVYILNNSASRVIISILL